MRLNSNARDVTKSKLPYRHTSTFAKGKGDVPPHNKKIHTKSGGIDLLIRNLSPTQKCVVSPIPPV